MSEFIVYELDEVGHKTAIDSITARDNIQAQERALAAYGAPVIVSEK
jgi:hypothetical protein